MSLTIDQLKALDALIQIGLDQSAPTRRAWFDALVIEQPLLRPLLERALFANRAVESGTFLDSPPGLGAFADEVDNLTAGNEIGPYTLDAVVGQGGSASVWRAHRSDGTMRREVAIKLPYFIGNSSGWHDRVSRERDILASLQHANIATIYEAGVAHNGRPWLALEFIDGQRIDDYCRKHQLLIDQRVQLVLRVLRALEHAHARGVIHRDIKPANLLVTKDGQPKLLDFGIAKLLGTSESDEAGATELTRLHGRPLTPEYASPEQLNGAAVTTSADIYSMGVVFYELLAGERPFNASALNASGSNGLIDLAQQRSAPIGSPSKRARLQHRQSASNKREAISKDLDAIAIKAIHYDADKRYSTANAFADDLDRYLRKETVSAQADGQWYRVKQFVRRNRIAVIAAGAISASLVVGASVATWQAFEAQTQRLKAEQESAKALAVKDFLVQLFEVNRDDQLAAAIKRKQPIETVLVDAAAKLPDAFAEQPLVRAEILRIVGGLFAGLSMSEPAIKLREAQLSTLIAAKSARVDIERARVELALSEIDKGDWTSGRRRLEDVVQTLNANTVREERAQLADALSLLGQLKAYSYDAKGAIELLNASILHAEAADTGNGALLAEPLVARAAAFSDLGDTAQVNNDLARAIAISERINGVDSLKTAVMHYRNYEAQYTLENIPAALKATQTALDILTRMGAEDSFWGARVKMAQGRMLGVTGASREALIPLNDAIKFFDRMAKELDADNQIVTRAYAAEAEVRLSEFAQAKARIDEAKQLLVDNADRVGGLVSSVSLARAEVAYQLAVRQPRAAITLAKSTLEALEKAGGTSPDIAGFAIVLAQAHLDLQDSSAATAALDALTSRKQKITVGSLTQSRIDALRARIEQERTRRN